MSTRTKKAKLNKVRTVEELKKLGVPVYALIYCRVSSERQAREGSGLDSQEQRCSEYARQHGLEVPTDGVFRDSHTGGGDFMNRPAMRKLLEYVDQRSHKNYVVIFDDISRFARDVAFHLKLRGEFDSREMIPKCLNFDFDESPEGRMAEIMIAAGSEYQRNSNRRQVLQKQVARLMRGYWPFPSRRPFKMTPHVVHGHILEAQYPDAQYLKEALEGFAVGTFVRKIDACRFLCEKGFWRGQRPEKYIDKFTEMAKSALNAGLIEYTPWEFSAIKGQHDGIISLEVYEKIQKRLKREGLSHRIRRDIRADLPLRGLMVCDSCRIPLRGAPSQSRGREYLYYVCHTKECKYYGKSIPQQLAEDRFKELLKKNTLKKEADRLIDIIFDRVWKQEVIAAKTNEAIMASHRTTLERKAEQLTEALFGARLPAMKKMYEAQLEKIAKELENPEFENGGEMDFSVPYRTALEKSRVLLKNPVAIWDLLDVHEQHRLFFFIFDQKLPYDLKEGYRTEKIRTAASLFEEFAAQNILDVEMPEIESGCNK